MVSFRNLLRDNRNYRYMWLGQIVSEVGDHFNSIAVLSLALHVTGTGAAVGGVMIARTLSAIIAAPIAGVTLDRLDRKRVMIASDVMRAVVAIAFVLVLTHKQQWLMYLLSGLLMFASPFFTSGRSAILPRITDPEELHTANALTQTTQWLTLSVGTMLGGVSTMQFGYRWAFVANALSFVFSAFAIWKLKSATGHFRAARTVAAHNTAHGQQFWNEFNESLRYMRRTPLILAIGLAGVGWASGGGAAQILFTLFGEVVFNRGAAGIGLIWGFAGIGLVIGGVFGHWLGRRMTFEMYKHVVWIGFLVHGGSYVLFSIGNLWNAILFITLSRVAMGCNNVLNRTMLLTHVPDHYRGRVFTTVEAMSNATMMASLAVASVATLHYDPRSIGVIAGFLSASTALFWLWAQWTGRLKEPRIEDSGEVTKADTVVPA
jgi:MFS family permease